MREIGTIPGGDEMGFFDIIIHPDETMAAEKKKASVSEAHKTFAIYGAIFGLIVGIFIAIIGVAVGGALGTTLNSIPLLGFFFGLGLLAVILVPILNAIFTVVFSYIWYFVISVVAQALGGTGTFEPTYYLGSRLIWPTLVASVIVGILGIIPFLGWLLQIVWFFYSIYLGVTLISVAHNMGKFKALLAFIIPVILLIVLIGMIFGALLIGLITAAAAASGGMS
jgi:hypothetical protein